MKPDELAQAIVDCGVGKRFPCEKEWWIYKIDGWPSAVPANQFIRNGDVVLAMMEKCYTLHIQKNPEGKSQAIASVWEDKYLIWQTAQHESLAIALLTAIVEALKGGDDG